MFQQVVKLKTFQLTIVFKEAELAFFFISVDSNLRSNALKNRRQNTALKDGGRSMGLNAGNMVSKLELNNS